MSVRAKKQIKKVVEYPFDGMAETTKEFLENYPDYQTWAEECHESIKHVELKCDGKNLIILAWPEHEEDLKLIAELAEDAPGAEGWDGMPY